jgi:DNA-directed RNA polymerase subunit RPC12/RpoP
MNRVPVGRDFRCLHCGAGVSSAPFLSGVRNRNHCPYCLWSRHLDWLEPGDRLSACKGGMPPIGLTFKRVRKKSGTLSNGELMVVHRCKDCGRVSINRIAGDDLASSLEELFRHSLDNAEPFHSGVQTTGIRLLNASDWGEVSRRLYGEIRVFDGAADCCYDRTWNSRREDRP